VDVKATSWSVQLDVINQDLEETSGSGRFSIAAVVLTVSPVCPATQVYDTYRKLLCNYGRPVSILLAVSLGRK